MYKNYHLVFSTNLIKFFKKLIYDQCTNFVCGAFEAYARIYIHIECGIFKSLFVSIRFMIVVLIVW